MATREQLFICHRIMGLCAKISAQKVGFFSCSYTGSVDSLSVHAYEHQEYEGKSLTYIEGWCPGDEGNNVYLGDWYDNNYGEAGECINRLRSLESRLCALLEVDEDGIPV